MRHQQSLSHTPAMPLSLNPTHRITFIAPHYPTTPSPAHAPAALLLLASAVSRSGGGCHALRGGCEEGGGRDDKMPADPKR